MTEHTKLEDLYNLYKHTSFPEQSYKALMRIADVTLMSDSKIFFKGTQEEFMQFKAIAFAISSRVVLDQIEILTSWSQLQNGPLKIDYYIEPVRSDHAGG